MVFVGFVIVFATTFPPQPQGGKTGCEKEG